MERNIKIFFDASDAIICRATLPNAAIAAKCRIMSHVPQNVADVPLNIALAAK
jgi:hypothetical protein